MDPKQLRSLFGRFATGVTVISTHDTKGNNYAMTVNSFSSVSLDPPLVMFCIIRESDTLKPIQDSGCFSVSMLSAEQQDLSNAMAKKGGPEKMNGVATFTAETGAPLLEGNIGWLDCKLWNTYEGGDHLILIGEVVDSGAPDEADPLLFFNGKYASLA